jgi:GNAT superfamily N-acetyltransferase
VFGRYEHKLIWWETLSLETGGLVEVLELRTPLRIIGRAHLFHVGETAILKELFVLPAMRRRGFGQILEEVAVERASTAGARTIEIWIGAGDARARVRPALDAFLEKVGYTCSPVDSERPRLVGIATKELS